ncbi:hypothetical protein PPYR_13343 [Photinus pyralis]|uniref:Tetratricopeptide SHNi-TPR domain-containing protein n=1 Tax=Photinus pyralis TaxID=7054 RepID=A0A1Y1MUX3_PHOPY|nr:histone-binding protein N1/N2-like [Photinus pyralis]KAB0793723.1 hypothetical protein PPYR_13343 [Photinus pyralis]
MADVAVESEIKDPKELVKLATKAEHIHDYNAAATAYSKAIEIIVAEHGDKHDSLGEIYLAYGKTLLEISRDEAEPLGDAVQREYSSESDAEEANGAQDKVEEVEKPPAENDEKPDEKTSEENKEEVKGDDGDGEPTNGSNDEEPTDLQLAWEVLEIAKLIFEQRDAAGRRGLSETLIVLGEVSLESENFESAVADMKAGLEIQKEICKPNDRTLAETYYKLGTALSTNNQIEEAIQSYTTSLEVLNKRLAKLKQDEEKQKDEIKDIEDLIPDILEKISDMKNFKEEATMKLVAAMASKPVAETKSSFEAGSSDKKISNISHLVKRKRKDDDVKEEENPSKKISP